MALEIPHPIVEDRQQTLNLESLKRWSEELTDYLNNHSASHLPGGSDALDTAPATTLTGSNTEGSAQAFARADHTHALPDVGPYCQVSLTGAPSDATATANNMYFAAIRVFHTFLMTGIMFQVGSASGGNVKAGLFRASTGLRVSQTTANVAVGGVLSFQKVPFSSPAIVAPGLYYAALVFSATPKFIAAPAMLNATALQASFAIPSSAPLPTTNSNQPVPIMNSYA